MLNQKQIDSLDSELVILQQEQTQFEIENATGTIV